MHPTSICYYSLVSQLLSAAMWPIWLNLFLQAVTPDPNQLWSFHWENPANIFFLWEGCFTPLCLSCWLHCTLHIGIRSKVDRWFVIQAGWFKVEMHFYFLFFLFLFFYSMLSSLFQIFAIWSKRGICYGFAKQRSNMYIKRYQIVNRTVSFLQRKTDLLFLACM